MSVERDWITEAGLRAVCLVVRNSHRCGYVEVPVGHPLHGLGYDTASPVLGPSHWAADEYASPNERVDVHGGITYADGGDGYPVESKGWWFGFDCAHHGDGSMDDNRTYLTGPVRSEEYVVRECESLARQLVALGAAP